MNDIKKTQPDPSQPDSMVPPDQELGELVEETHEPVIKTLEEVQAEHPGSKTLEEYLAELEAEKENPDIAERLRKLQLVILKVGQYAKIETSKILLRPQEGLTIGEAHIEGDFIELDPVLVESKDALEEFRHALLHEYVGHLVHGLKSEALVELKTSRITGEVRDYHDLVQNCLQVTDVLGAGDVERGIDRACELYTAKDYTTLYMEFKGAYEAKHLEAKDTDTALNIFQLAFPGLEVNEDGEWEEDKKAIEAEYAKVAGGMTGGVAVGKEGEPTDGEVGTGEGASAVVPGAVTPEPEEEV